MYTVTFSAGAVFMIGMFAGVVLSAIGVIAAAVATSKNQKNKGE